MKFRSWSEVTAIFGGTFDPPHEGHVTAVFGLFREPGILRALVVPAASPPHKPCVASSEDRVKMTRLAFAQAPSGAEIRVELLELERARTHPGVPSYSFDTISELRRGDPQLAFVIGTDQLSKLHTWHRFPEILELCHWIVLERKPDGRNIALQTLKEWASSGLLRPLSETNYETRSETRLALVPTEAPGISSTDIRQTIGREGTPAAGTVPEAVLAHLKAHRIYGTTGHPNG